MFVNLLFKQSIMEVDMKVDDGNPFNNRARFNEVKFNFLQHMKRAKLHREHYLCQVRVSSSERHLKQSRL